MSKLQEYINAAYNAVNKTPEAHELKPIMNPGPKSKKVYWAK